MIQPRVPNVVEYAQWVEVPLLARVGTKQELGVNDLEGVIGCYEGGNVQLGQNPHCVVHHKVIHPWQ